MNHSTLIRTILNDLAHGERHTAIGALDYYLADCRIPKARLVSLLNRKFKIPLGVIEETLKELYTLPYVVH